jgi:hypothetical protein
VIKIARQKLAKHKRSSKLVSGVQRNICVIFIHVDQNREDQDHLGVEWEMSSPEIYA